MKNKSLLMSMLLMVTATMLFVSCSKEGEEQQSELQEACFTLDYVFSESGSMTRAVGSEVYGNFYDKYIKTKVLTPRTYHLEFMRTSDNAVVMTVDGQWGDMNGVRLPEGEYNVVGYSRPMESYADRPQTLPSDTVYISFDEKVNIVKDATSLVLNAKYDSYLLLFDYENVASIELNVGPKQLSHDDVCYWLFAKEKSWTNWDNGFSFTHYLSVDVVKNEGDDINIVFGKLPLEVGKYYYFNDMTNTFDLPQMDSGN